MFANISNEGFLEMCALLPVKPEAEEFELKHGPHDYETRQILFDELKKRFPDREYSFESHVDIPILKVNRIR